MMEDFLELLRKKAKEQGGPRMDEKMKAKRDMSKAASDMLGEEMMDKVVVSSNSPEGLKKGLEKAEDVLESKMKDESEDMEDESMDEEKDSEDMDEEEVQMEIAKLEKQLEKLKAKA